MVKHNFEVEEQVPVCRDVWETKCLSNEENCIDYMVTKCDIELRNVTKSVLYNQVWNLTNKSYTKIIL